ncbi:Gfo/Idh/MocA family protein [Labrenzia sp. PHM005]|uniref:Gfo/Idh/MocA family protein n=1 Tax=Labrenzia sp. PHM005 TaxID=2590016 RepID=UPI0011402CB0|nr:Gfo/Idh/MocA family oxidoreductase [Labrenzia sp. PHM005]QDG78064.1 Gfo/Idh/MocA family oxidoreductase [Labrenzia sp. PHM005]
MVEEVGIGILGCGKTSKPYFDLIPAFQGLKIRACADLNRDAAQVRASENGIRLETVHDLLMAEDVDLIVNLTTPDAHGMVIREILTHGKHVYSEKPLVPTLSEGEAVMDLARQQNLQVGCAPDTFMGGAWQSARKAIDDGLIGQVIGGTCHAMTGGIETWHPSPETFYKAGGGPVLDFGPYYLAALVNLIGPVRRVCAMHSMPQTSRKIGFGSRKGTSIDVEVPTTVHASMMFETGALISFLASWDVEAHAHTPIELYGTEGTLFLPDPVFFGGDVVCVTKSGERKVLDTESHPFSRPNLTSRGRERASYRAAGLADMVSALQIGGEFRCTIERALHSVEVIEAIRNAGATGQTVDITHSATRPAPLSAVEAEDLMR